MAEVESTAESEVESEAEASTVTEEPSDDASESTPATKGRYMCAIRINNDTRAVMAKSLALVDFFAIILSLLMISIGVYIKMTLQQYVDLIPTYDHTSLPYLLMSAGGFSGLINGIGGLLLFLKSERNARFVTYLGVFILASIVVCMLMFAGGIMCFTTINSLEDSFRGGLEETLSEYKNKPSIKEVMDDLQIAWECCGSDSYTDWFKTSWIDTKYVSPDQIRYDEHGEFKPHDVPFSCCDPDANRPCIHHSVDSPEMHAAYSYPAGLTIHRDGCKHILLAFIRTRMLFVAGGITLGIFLFQVILVMTGRYLHTSTKGAIKKGDNAATADGYLFPCGGGGRSGKKASKPEETEKLLDSDSEKSDSEESEV